MPENFAQFTIRTHIIRIDTNKFDVGPNNGFVIVTAKDNSGLKAIISIESISRIQSRDEIWRDTVTRDPLGTLHQMMNIATSPEAVISGFNTNLIINGHQGFDVVSSTSTLAAYRICYWLENGDALDIFAASPADVRIKEEIMSLATSILLN